MLSLTWTLPWWTPPGRGLVHPSQSSGLQKPGGQGQVAALPALSFSPESRPGFSRNRTATWAMPMWTHLPQNLGFGDSCPLCVCVTA